MRASTARVRLLPPAAAVLALAACASAPAAAPAVAGGPAATSTHAGGGPAATYRGPLTRPIDDPRAGIVLEIPHAQPRLPWQTVFDSCAAKHGGCDPTSSPTIDLAVATTPHQGHANPDGSIAPTMDHRLAYVFVWHGLSCVSSGGGPHPASSTATPTPVPPSKCTMIILADANSGAFEYDTYSPAYKE